VEITTERVSLVGTRTGATEPETDRGGREREARAVPTLGEATESTEGLRTSE
jgi:hypothetical protein